MMLSKHPAHCHAECSRGAGSSVHHPLQTARAEKPSAHRARIRPVCSKSKSSLARWMMTMGLVASISSSAPTSVEASPSFIDTAGRGRMISTEEPPSLAELITKRNDIAKRQGQSVSSSFEIGVTPPQTCEQMNITFDTRGGQPPYTVLVAFDNWYSSIVSLPASYADSDVEIWMYPFQVPLFSNPPQGSSETPVAFVVVGDSTGRQLNTSSFQSVKPSGKSCDRIAGNLDFTFFTDNDTVVCQDLGIYWSSKVNVTTLPSWTDPLNAYVFPEQLPPQHISIANASAGNEKFPLTVPPGRQIVFSMTDKNGSGGVSGVNTAGGSEYVSQDCLKGTLPNPAGMPAATTVLNNARMPDYTATVSSTITGADGSVSTSTSTEVVHNGRVVGPNLGTSQIAGLSVGVAIAAALIAALATWYVWRRRHGRRVVFWDLPKESVTQDGPIDPDYIKNYNSRRQRSPNASTTTPMLALSPTSESSEEREHNRRMNSGNGRAFGSLSDASLSESQYHRANSDSPTDDQRHFLDSMADRPPRRVSGGSTTSNPFTDRQPSVGHSQRRKFDSSASSMARSRSNGIDESQPYSSASSYPPVPSRRSGAESSPQDRISLVETGNQTSAGRNSGHAAPSTRHSGSGTRAMTDASQTSFSTQGTSTRSQGTGTLSSRRVPEFVQHSDAGLLMDDALEHEETNARIELPPQYHEVPSARSQSQSMGTSAISSYNRQQHHGTFGHRESSDLGQHPLFGASSSALDQRRGEHGNDEEDESEFWRDAEE